MADPVCVEHSFGVGNDMFSKNPQEDEMTRPNPRYTHKQMTGFTVEVTTYPGTTETFTDVDDARISDGFLRIIQDGKTTAFNVQDVSRTVSYEGS